MTRENDRERLTTLMNGEIDGTNDATASAELEERLSVDADARAEFESLRTLSRRLDAIPAVEPPPHLIHRIIASVPFGRVDWPRSAHADGVGAWLGGLFPRFRLRYVATFATGLVAGFVLLWVAVSGDRVDRPLDISNLYGTMRAIESSDGFAVVGSTGIEAGEVRGEVRLHESDRKLLAEISLNTPDEIEWVLDYGDADVAFEGFRQLEGNSGDVRAANNTMTVSHSGAGRYLLFFTERGDGDHPMSIEIFSSGNLLYQKDLRRN
jgi:hypothetical protein